MVTINGKVKGFINRPRCPYCGATELDDLGDTGDSKSYGCPNCHIQFTISDYDPNL